MTNPLTGGWIKTPPGGSPFSTFDPGQLVADILDDVTGVRYSESGNSEGNYRISGTAGAPVLEPIVGEVDADKTVQFELTIDPSTYRLTRAEIRGAVTEAEDPATVRVVDLSDFDSAIDIKPPA